MPGQEKMVMDYYQKNPSATDSLRGTIYEDKIIEAIKKKVIINKKEITKEAAEKILKSANEEHDHNHDHDHSKNKQKKSSNKPTKSSKTKTSAKKTSKIKKVSKK